MTAPTRPGERPPLLSRDQRRLQVQQLQQLLMVVRAGVFDGALAQHRRRGVPRPQRLDVAGLLFRQLLMAMVFTYPAVDVSCLFA